MFPKKKKQEDLFIPIEEEGLFPDTESGTDPQDPKSTTKKLPGWVIIPIIGAVIAIAAAGSALFGTSDSSTSQSLAVTTVKTGTVQEIYNSSGTIESENTKTYYSPVTAPILSCNAKVGNAVRSGDLLVTFDTTNLERDNQQAQLTLQSSRNTSTATRAQNAKAIDAANAANAAAAEQANALAEQVNTLAGQVNAAADAFRKNQEAADAQNTANAQMRAELQKTIDENTQILSQMQNVIDRVETGYAGRRTEYDALKQKKAENPSYQYTEAELALIQAFDSYDLAQEEKAAAQTRLNAANAQLAGISDIPIDDAGYTQLKARYEEVYAQWVAAREAAGSPVSDTGMTSAELENLNISDNLAELAALSPAELVAKGKEGMKADMNGVIASVETQTGNTATQGLAMFTIASTDQVRVRLELSPDDYGRLKEGLTASVTIGEKTYTGTLSKIDKIALKNEKGNSVIGADVHINNPDADICIGATAKVSMTIAKSEDVLVVPSEVINTSSDGDFVYVIENGFVREKPVETGTSSTTQTEIRSGLKKGDQVVSDLNVEIKAGMKATAAEASSKKDSTP